jgi:hypothetical protein
MRRAAAIAIFGLLPWIAALADVYRSVDAQGHVQYSDTPTPGAELVHVQNLRAQQNPSGSSLTSSAGNNPGSNPGNPTSPGANATTANASAAGATLKSDPARDTLAQQAAQQAVEKDLAATRAEQCTKATDNYNSSVQARRIYRTGQDGEREYLTDAEADEQRLNLRLAMESACNTAQ